MPTVGERRDLAWRRRVEAAIEILNERGWCQGFYHDGEGSVDVIGALFLADGIPNPDRAGMFEFGTTALGRAVEMVERHVGGDLGAWNDRRTMTKAKVIETLQEVLNATDSRRASEATRARRAAAAAPDAIGPSAPVVNQ